MEGLKRAIKYLVILTAIVTVSSYGERPDNLRAEFNMLAAEDIKDSMVSLSTIDGQMDKLFNYKFNSGRLNGLHFSDIYFSAMKQILNENF